MNRRDFIKTSLLLLAGIFLPRWDKLLKKPEAGKLTEARFYRSNNALAG